jgi:hypothetical protein
MNASESIQWPLPPHRGKKPPNNSLKLTRRAALSGMLVLPAGVT